LYLIIRVYQISINFKKKKKMKKKHVVFNFIRFNYSQKVEKGRNVAAKIRANGRKFSDPDVTAEQIEAKTEELENCRIAALNGDREATALLRQKALEWDDMMRIVANYVDRIAEGDDAVIIGAGFDFEKQPDPAVRPVFKAELGPKSGSVILRRQAMPGAKAYIMQVYIGETAPTNEKDWIQLQVISKASLELSGLLTLTKYWFRVAVVTAEGTIDFCQPFSLVVI
jgi:hypothetical protein